MERHAFRRRSLSDDLPVLDHVGDVVDGSERAGGITASIGPEESQRHDRHIRDTRHANAVTYQVGSGKPFSTIQAAINQAEADAPASTVLPVIQIFTGTYNEVATLHNDPNYNVNAPTKYDGWTIQAAPGANVIPIKVDAIARDSSQLTRRQVMAFLHCAFAEQHRSRLERPREQRGQSTGPREPAARRRGRGGEAPPPYRKPAPLRRSPPLSYLPQASVPV